MKKLKDLLYDKNDIVIAVLILAIAATIIIWRLDVILQYPKLLIENNDANISEETDKPADSTDNNSGNKPADSTDSDSGNKPADGSSNDSNDDTTTDTPQNTALWLDGKLSKDVEVDVTGTTASAAIGCLVEAGLFEDYDEYKSLCDAAGLDHEKVGAGTFTFKAGTTKAQIARKMNWS